MATAASEAPPLAVNVGDVVLSRYRVIEQIACGGHSVVFRGHDERLSRPVCIKVFSSLGKTTGVGRTSYEHFVQEAFALSRLTHPNTLRIYDFGHLGPKDAAGMPLQVCEYMNGGTLANVIREQGMQSITETAHVITAMCLALGEAHGLGIVHRDIKPQNILFGTVGNSRLPKLADFGIAKWSADDDHNRDQRAEDTAIVAGQKLAMYSPSWAAPEQLAGQPVSPATDIYSLACVAAYMLSGRAIFADEDVYAGYRKRRQGDALLREALASIELPRAVVDLLVKALAFEPRQRLSTVDQFAAELAHAIEPATDEIVTTPDRDGRGSRDGRVGSITSPAIEPPPVLQSAPSPPFPFAAPMVPSSSWTPPPVALPWMAVTTQHNGPARRLPLSELPQQVSDRRTHYVFAPNQVADLVGPHNSRIRVTFQSGPTGARVLHLKGMTCFVAPVGGRPSPAVLLEHGSDIALVTPRAQEIGHVRVATGKPGSGERVFPVGTELVAIAESDCSDPILFDFGPGSEAYFVYTQGRPAPKPRRG
jgi:serine/threonine protein kinase